MGTVTWSPSAIQTPSEGSVWGLNRPGASWFYAAVSQTVINMH